MKFCNSHLTRNIFNLYMRRFFIGLVYLESADKIKKIFLKYFFFSTFQKITVGGLVYQLIKKIWPKLHVHV